MLKPMYGALLLLTITYAYFLNEPATLKPFDMLEGRSFTAYGFHTSKFVGEEESSPPYNPVTWVMDVSNQRLFINHTNNIHYLFDDISYFQIPAFPGAPCFVRPNYNFTTHVNNYLGLSDIGSGLLRFPTGFTHSYAGWIHDHHACKDVRIGVAVEKNWMNRLSRWLWTAPLHIPQYGLDTIVTQALWLNYYSDIVHSQHFDLPVECLNPIDFDAFFGC